MQIKALVGAGDRIIGLTLPFAAVGIAANIIWPRVFALGPATGGLVAGIVLVAAGLPIWLVSIAQVLFAVPKGKLITTGSYALMLHPLYTSVALLVIPGCGLLLDTWVGFAIGAVLYFVSRVYSPREERELASHFGEEYAVYRRKVWLPWL